MDRDGLIDRYLAAAPHSRSEILRRPSPIPATPGVYGWWFRCLPAAIDVHPSHLTGGRLGRSQST
jgi:hypothetical protein